MLGRLQNSRCKTDALSTEPILFESLSDTGEVQFVRAGFPFVLARLHVEP